MGRLEAAAAAVRQSHDAYSHAWSAFGRALNMAATQLPPNGLRDAASEAARRAQDLADDWAIYRAAVAAERAVAAGAS